MSKKKEVKDASRSFYAALNRMANGDARSMGDVWAHGAAVTAMHPIGGRKVGWDEVRTSFEQVAQLASDGHIELRDQLIRVEGDLAYEIGVEHGEFKLAAESVTIEQRVTNVYKRKARGWRIVHHHTDSSPAMIDLLARLQGQS